MAGDHDERIQTITMPKWGLSMTTGKIVEWFVAEGDVLGKGDDVVDIDTDKIAGTLESPVTGPVRRLVAEVGDQLPIGAVLVVVAPEEVPDSEIDAVVAEAKEAAASGRAGGAGRAATAARRDRRPDDLLLHADRGGAGR
jgi:pyruvate dehydrogenase E2 component (dihydrolipoamide acetyltransferase)